MGEDGGTGVLKENSLTQHSRGQILGMLRLRAGSSFAGTRSPLSMTKGMLFFKLKHRPFLTTVFIGLCEHRITPILAKS
jgi:hypothetical protein